jgi:hypothetical protein
MGETTGLNTRSGTLWLGRWLFLKVRGKLLDDELLEEAGDAAFRDPDQRTLQV